MAARCDLVREVTRDELLELADSNDGPLVSIYLATSGESSLAGRRIAWTKLTRSAERQLTTEGVVGRPASRMRADARRVIDTRDARARGIAYFAGTRWSRVLSLAISVPTTAVVGDRCYLRPLLPLLEPTDHYYVLGLSREEVRFFAGSRELVKELPLVGLPLAPLASMPPERHPATTFDKQPIVAFFREVDAAVRKILGDSGAPLVLGGVDYLQGLYQRVSSCPTLIPDGIIGELGDMTSTQLHERAWPLVEAKLHAERREALARFAQLDGSGRTLSQLSATADASDEGRVETLIVAAVDMSGAPDGNMAGVSENLCEDRMLLERAVAGTLRHNGTVHAVNRDSMPTSTSLAAILRY
jgi:hypothetical protein